MPLYPVKARHYCAMTFEMNVNYDGRAFRPVSNSGSGEANSETRFEYHQTGSIVWATYSGGPIQFGTLIATVASDGSLDMRYSHVNAAGQLATGLCGTTPELLTDGRLRLHESWQWTSGDRSSGNSVLEEI